MRRILPLFLIIVAQVFLSVEARAQAPELACPSIRVKVEADSLASVTSGLACPGTNVTFTADIAGTTRNDQPTFNWTIFGGEIISGQGTSKIRVTADETVGGVKATVEVGNVSTLKAECDHTASAAIELAMCCLRPCPTIEISCPVDTIRAGEPVPVAVNLSYSGPDFKLKYHWQVSGGKIIKGQETAEILVDMTEGIGQVTTATVEIDGLPPECERARSCSFSIADLYTPPSPRKYDEYGDVSWISEEARLTNFATQLQEQTDAKGYLILYGPRRIDQRLARVRKFLTEQRGIDSNRIVLINGGFNRKAKVELWLVPEGANPPKPNPTF